MTQKTGDWQQARAAVNAMAARYQRASARALKGEAQLFRRRVVEAFNSRGKSNGQAWVPNKPSTVRKKGSSKPLIDSGQLRNSIEVIDGPAGVFVGVSSKVQRKGGGPLVNIAEVHEYGKVVAQARGGGIVLIKIPERSFLRATAKAHFAPKDVAERMVARTAAGMGAGWAVQLPPSAAGKAKKR